MMFNQAKPYGTASYTQPMQQMPDLSQPLPESGGMLGGLLKSYLGGAVLGGAGDAVGAGGAAGTAVNPNLVNEVTREGANAATVAQSAPQNFFDHLANSNPKIGLMRDTADSFMEGYDANSMDGFGQGLMGGVGQMGTDMYNNVQGMGQNVMDKGQYYINSLWGN